MIASQKWWFTVAIFNAPVRSMQRGKLLSLCSREGVAFQGCVERETSLASLKREGVVFQGLLCLPLKSGGFLWQF